MRGRSSGQWSTINPHAAGLDVGATFHVVAVAPDRDEQPVRTFGTFSGDLHRLADWLQRVGITTVAMESTGVYWIPAFEILEARGIAVVLVNARHVKHVPGRKSDVNDAQWLQQLHQYGLLRGSFRPREEVTRLRAYLRHRERLVEYAAAHIGEAHAAARKLGLEVDVLEVRRAEDIVAAFGTLDRSVQALYVCPDPLINANHARINTLALGARLPTIHPFRDYLGAGGLMSYGANNPDLFRRAGDYVDKILRGAKPADLPVEQPTKFDFIINLPLPRRLASTCRRRCSPAPTR